MIAATPPANVVATKLLSPRFVAATSKSNSLVARELKARVFEKQRQIIYRHRSDLWTRWFTFTGFPATRGGGVNQVDTLPAAISAAERGLGISLVPTFVCERRLRCGLLVRIADAEVESDDNYYMVYRPEDRLRPGVRAFLSWALAELRR